MPTAPCPPLERITTARVLFEPTPLAVEGARLRAAWLELRRSGVGASDLPSIMGLTSWGSPLSVAAEKKGLAPDRESQLMRWSRREETALIDWFDTEAEGVKVDAWPAGHLLRCQEPNREFLLCTPDGFALDLERQEWAVLEAKNARFTAAQWRDYGLPEHVRVQVHAQMIVTGWRLGYVLVLLDGYEPKWVRVEWDLELANRVIDAGARFWWNYIHGGRFDVTVGPYAANRDALKVIHPLDTGERIQLSGPPVEGGKDPYVDAWERWQRYSAAFNEAKRKRDRAKVVLEDAMGTASFAELANGQVISFKHQTNPERVQAESTFRVLRSVKPDAPRKGGSTRKRGGRR